MRIGVSFPQTELGGDDVRLPPFVQIPLSKRTPSRNSRRFRTSCPVA
jgi:hypothetical protein